MRYIATAVLFVITMMCFRAAMAQQAVQLPQGSPMELVQQFEETDVSQLPVYDDYLVDLWDWYEVLRVYDQLLEELSEIDEVNPQITTHNRLLQELAAIGEVYIVLMREIRIRDGELSDREREAMLDGELTMYQNLGSFYRDLGMCDVALERLEFVLGHAGLDTRSILERDTRSTHDAALLCVHRQRAVQLAELHAAGITAVAARWMPTSTLVFTQGEEDPHHGSTLTLPIVTIVTGASLLIVGGTLQSAAMRDADRYEDEIKHCGTVTGCSSVRLESIAARAEQRHTLGMIGMVSGGVALLGGSIWTIVRIANNDDPRVTPTATVGPLGVRAGLRVEW